MVTKFYFLIFPSTLGLQKNICYLQEHIHCAQKYSRGYKKRATSGKFYLTLNEQKTYFEITFVFFFRL
jgi:hypothetical protein